MDGATLSGRDEFSSFGLLITSDFWRAVWSLSVIFTRGSSVGGTDAWLANVTLGVPFVTSVVNDTVNLANAALASLVLAAALVGVSGLSATSIALFVLALLHQKSALGGVANAVLLRAALVESLGDWLVTDFTETVWVVFWVGFVALDADALTSIVLAAVGTELLLVDKLLALWTRMVLVKTAASSEFSEVLARSSTVGTAATWLANVVVFVPLVSDWVFNIVVGTSVDW